MGYIGAGITRFNTADELTVTGDAQIDTTTLVVDSTNNRVGIGTSSPSNQLHIYGTSPIIRLEDSGASGRYARINADGSIGALVLESDSGGVGGSIMNFKVGGSERMRLDASGNLLVGTTTGAGTIGTYNGFGAFAGGSIFSAATSNRSIFSRRSTDGSIIEFRKDSTTVGSISSSSGKTAITLDPRSAATTGSGFLGGDGVIFPSDKTGVASDADVSLGGASTRFKDLYLSGGAYLGGTGSANHLDDYEEGTWTPTLDTVSSANSITYTSQQGQYIKIGRKITVHCRILWSAVSSVGSGLLMIGGLPFSINGGSSAQNGGGTMAYASGLGENGLAYGDHNTTRIVLIKTGTAATYFTQADLGSAGQVMATFTYETS